jgi:hypothetical protein
MRIYRVAGCKTEIEIRAESPDYERIDAAEALALLRELPDPRFIRRRALSLFLALSLDHPTPSFYRFVWHIGIPTF